ncbi:RNA-directed RNA polymerase [ssRNA phage SRR6960803_12]|uniref:RNA-directed RNA polymerase n=1 Tax=ssRNA phage SRR6960803_12 TaxID=2786615 RepID=A0A8S5KZB0_9VIRU|nr:RNA-directed RNA polymerase [ssRNA phage SRR6960803_12]DAD50737.1 TPA_asm: RNA-directed RNA polymerase [ssRNA phage SRR6960803_12]
MSANTLPSDVVRIARKYLSELATPMSLDVLKKIEERNWDGVSDVNPDPRSYTDAETFYRDACAAALLRKYQGLPTTHDRRGNAVAKWWEGERDCYRSNERLSPYLEENRLFLNEQSTSPEARISDFLSEVRKVIRSWIGFGPPTLIEGRFGPGATFAVRGGRTTVPDKMTAVPSLTRDAIWFLPQWLGTQWGSSVAAHHGEVCWVPGNRFSTVPKTSKTDRAIAAEPCINVFYQLGVGRILRERLKRATGWDLAVASDIHRRVACESSSSREFATLDLSNASDTVGKILVKILLPRLWYDCLDALRSKKTYIDGRWVMLEKFSSMGNGFTFELETLIFAAVSCVVSKRHGHKGMVGEDVFVFGDDIIVKDDVVSSLVPVLRFLGFTLNKDKSFFGDTSFRESCGGDFFKGKSVRPYFLKEEPRGPQDYIAFANGLSRVGEAFAEFGLALHRPAWFAVLDQIPSRVRRCRGPKALGDLVITEEDPERWTIRVKRSIRYLMCFRPHRHRKVHYVWFSPSVVLACATYGTGNSPGGVGPDGRLRASAVVPRDGVLSYKVGWVAYS